MRALAVILALAAGPALAQDSNLADIRQELANLYGSIDGLRSELTASGTLTEGVAGATPLDRLNAIEAELQRLTSRTEELEFRLSRVVADGTNRIGDLEFRLCELETGCDISNLGETPTLGGSGAPTMPAPAPAAPSATPDLALAEEQDYQAAIAALDAGDFQTAADLLQAFATTYPGSPVEVQANLALGQALSGLGRDSDAARAYLASFSAAPEGDVAPEALFHLGSALAEVGQVPDGCVTLAEVGLRFPSSPFVGEAQDRRSELGCP
ncbi:tetratricopeptide repeat protein [Salipiger sp. IMCC34102]|uniref:tetratricopeptide repeat protein n=1 Tax=Salipiger sp. IMCC34102 TaxID=2510647 RepID=UPI00101D4648|nr:tetratricopeptide repeat protein [Salipiger sp. IMCC34102]RYH01152.1 tetratricopeptide repeat protein [Salipiger sp. IMCC34102]